MAKADTSSVPDTKPEGTLAAGSAHRAGPADMDLVGMGLAAATSGLDHSTLGSPEAHPADPSIAATVSGGGYHHHLPVRMQEELGDTYWRT